MSKLRIAIGILFVALTAFIGVDSVLADSPSVTAVLSNSEVTVGETVQLQIRITGASEAVMPPDISIDGLEIHATGTSRQFEMHNLSMSSSVTYNYTVLPLRPGTFNIPPQTIRVGGSVLRTPELTLHVAASPGRQAAPNRAGAGSNVDTNRVAFAELVVPKKSAYVGEMVPIVIRVGLFSRGQIVSAPEITGQGFTLQKLQLPDQSQLETINGRQCNVYTFKTAIAAARPGKFDIGPAETSAVVVVPRRQSTSRPRSPFDLFNSNDPFADPFFADPFGTFGQQQKITIKSDSVALEIKPLPSNAPSNFSGAVGNFTMNVDANPKNLQLGDPITVTATISGRGNFDRVNAPALEDEHGWHKYPPSSKFKQDDNVGISGAKTFETVLSPNEKKQAISSFAFSFFDPQKEQYVSLKSDPIPIRVEGGAAPTPNIATTQPGAATPAAAAPKATPKPADILYQLMERPARAQSFTPLFARPNFWLAQIVPLFALLAFVGWKIREARLDNREAQRIAALHHESAELMRKLQREDGSPQEYYSQASRVVQVKTALARNVDPNTVDVDAAAAAFQLDDHSREQLRRLFERSDELRYSGAGNGVKTISPEHRREVFDLIEHLRT